MPTNEFPQSCAFQFVKKWCMQVQFVIERDIPRRMCHQRSVFPLIKTLGSGNLCLTGVCVYSHKTKFCPYEIWLCVSLSNRKQQQEFLQLVAEECV
jgi:hypothetical protein